LELKECLVGGDLARLRRAGLSFKYLQRLPAQPAEFVIVPHVHKGPAGTRVLNIGVAEICSVDCTVIFERPGNVKVADSFAARIADDVAQAAVVHPLRSVFGIPDDLVYKVAKMQHKAKLL
jgi:hypothetical protein